MSCACFDGAKPRRQTCFHAHLCGKSCLATLFGNCLAPWFGGVWQVFGGVWQMFGRCLADVWQMFGRCLAEPFSTKSAQHVLDRLLEGDIIAGPGKPGPKDPHAGAKRELAASHKKKKLPIDEPEKHEGKSITSGKLQKDAAEDLRKEADRLEAEASKNPPQSEGTVPATTTKRTKKAQDVEERQTPPKQEGADEKPGQTPPTEPSQTVPTTTPAQSAPVQVPQSAGTPAAATQVAVTTQLITPPPGWPQELNWGELTIGLRR